MLYIQAMEHYIAMRMGDLKTHSVICVSLTNMMLNERSQTQNSAYCMVTLMESPKQQNYPVLPGQLGLVPGKEHIRPSQVVVYLTVWVLPCGCVPWVIILLRLCIWALYGFLYVSYVSIKSFKKYYFLKGLFSLSAVKKVNRSKENAPTFQQRFFFSITIYSSPPSTIANCYTVVCVYDFSLSLSLSLNPSPLSVPSG